MNRSTLVLISGLFLLSACGSKESALDRANTALGKPASVTYSGSGMNAFFGQVKTQSNEWPRRDLKSFSATADYEHDTGSLVLDFQVPVFFGQHQEFYVRGERAWNIYDSGLRPDMYAAEERHLDSWMTPHGFLRAAATAADLSVTPSGKGAVVTYTAMGKFKLTGTIDEQGMITRVETLFPDPLLGNMPYSFDYSDYKDFGGVKFPGHIVQSEGGSVANDFTVTAVQINTVPDLAVPDAIQSAPVIPPVISTKVVDGVWFLSGERHHSVLVEFEDHLVLIEAPLREQRALSLIEEAKNLVPGKPITVVVNSHHHFDHAGGLRAFVAQGATIYTHVSNKDYYQKAFTTPSSDAQGRAPKEPKIETVDDTATIADATHRIDLFSVVGDNHSSELLMAYIPALKILVEADSYSPPPAGTPPPATPPADTLVLYDNIQRLKLDVGTIIGLHGRGATPYDEFLAYAGKK